MADINVTSYGKVEGIIKNVLMSNGGTETDRYGRYYLDGQMVGVELAQAIIESIYLNEVFINGLNCTSVYTDDTRPNGAVRVALDTLFKPSSRTLTYGGRKGTPGNDGIFDATPPTLATSDEIIIYNNQVNTQDIVFPDISRAYIPLDLMTRKLSGYGKSVAQDRTASTLAEVIAYCIYRALNDGNNLVNTFDGTQNNAYANLVAGLNAKFTNGDPITGAMTFPTEGRCVICRPEFGYGIFNKNSGVILNGSDLAQKILLNYDLSVDVSERRMVPSGYIGEFGGMHFIVVPDQFFTFAERYLNLTDGALSNVKAIALSAGSLAIGRAVDMGVKLQDSTYPYPRGIMARPINIWGHEMFRKGFLIGDATLTNDYLTSIGFSANERRYPVAPNVANDNHKITVPVYGTDGAVVGYQQIAQGQNPSGDNWRSGLSTVDAPVASVKGGSYTAAQTVTLTSGTPDADIYYTTDGSEPTMAGGTKYSEAITISATTTLKAIAIKNGMVPSGVTSETYTITAAK